MFNLDTKFRDIYENEKFSEFKKYVFPYADNEWFNNEFLELTARTFYNPNQSEYLLDGLNYLYKLQDKKNIFYSINDEGLGFLYFGTNRSSNIIFVCAGGGYENIWSITEGFPIAKYANELGYNVVIVNYSVANDGLLSKPIDELSKTIKYVLDRKEEFKVESDNYLVAGFSAGGHLVSSYGTDILGYKNYNLPKPSALILSYPVITMGDLTHEGSRNWLLGKENLNNKELISKYSTELNVTSEYPPTYIWHCGGDTVVPYRNSVMMVEEFERNDIDYIFKTIKGPDHGLSLGVNSLAYGWFDEAITFWNKHT